jgi:hypothetical protein
VNFQPIRHLSHPRHRPNRMEQMRDFFLKDQPFQDDLAVLRGNLNRMRMAYSASNLGPNPLDENMFVRLMPSERSTQSGKRAFCPVKQIAMRFLRQLPVLMPCFSAFIAQQNPSTPATIRI